VISKEGLLHENIAMGALCVKAPVCFKVFGIKAKHKRLHATNSNECRAPDTLKIHPKLGIAQRT
jgi:hypothetical protein